MCRNQFTGQVVDCYDSTFGWFNPTDACYYKLVEPQPPATDPAWEGHYPNGAIYDIVCPGIIGTGGGWGWSATPPPGFGPTVTAAQLAQEAIRRLQLLGPEIGMAPPPTSTGLVGVPVWLWTAVTPATWGPTSATASVPGLSVTATARADHIVWDMGDAHSVTCANPGTPYRQSLGGGRVADLRVPVLDVLGTAAGSQVHRDGDDDVERDVGRRRAERTAHGDAIVDHARRRR